MEMDNKVAPILMEVIFAWVKWSEEKVGIFVEMARELAVKMILDMFSDNETNFELCTNSGGVVGNGGEIGWIGRGRRTSRRRRRPSE